MVVCVQICAKSATTNLINFVERMDIHLKRPSNEFFHQIGGKIANEEILPRLGAQIRYTPARHCLIMD